VSKRIDDKMFEKFVRDVKALRTVHTDAKICSVMGTNPGNFSSRVNGVKRPGKDFIDKFYQFWGTVLSDMSKGLKYEAREISLPTSANPNQGAPGYSLYQDERIRRIEESISRLDKFTNDLMERLVLNHLKLVDAHLSILEQQAKSAANRPCEQQPAAS
jgi:hypothetical protein